MVPGFISGQVFALAPTFMELVMGIYCLWVRLLRLQVLSLHHSGIVLITFLWITWTSSYALKESLRMFKVISMSRIWTWLILNGF